jgi:hypothetical protein
MIILVQLQNLLPKPKDPHDKKENPQIYDVYPRYNPFLLSKEAVLFHLFIDQRITFLIVRKRDLTIAF